MTTQERHVFCAWCWRAVPAHGGTYVPRPHPDTLGKPCRGEAMCGATTYSVGTPPCERGEPRTFAFAYAVPDAATIETVLAERSAETEALRAEVTRMTQERNALQEALRFLCRADVERCWFCGATATKRSPSTSWWCDVCAPPDAVDHEHAATLRPLLPTRGGGR